MPTDKQFTGQRLDSTGLYYYGARYYDPTIGRFISPDTIVPNPNKPQSLNRYSYTLNNPLKYIDPSGNYWISADDDPGVTAVLVQAGWRAVGTLLSSEPDLFQSINSFNPAADLYGVSTSGSITLGGEMPSGQSLPQRPEFSFGKGSVFQQASFSNKNT